MRLKEEKEEISRKDSEIELKKKQQKKLERQTRIIGYKVKAMKDYEKYLQSVMDEHADDDTDINDIKSRYDTLKKSDESLIQYQTKVTMEYEALRDETARYQKAKDVEIMSLNNQIAI